MESSHSGSSGSARRRDAAERYFRGVYGGDPSVVDDLADDDIVVSYPIFETVFGAPVIRGRDAARRFAIRFAQRWTEPDMTIHESLVDGDVVVLIWSFRAKRDGSSHAWGGMTCVRFGASGRIVEDVGEESKPGPIARLQATSRD